MQTVPLAKQIVDKEKFLFVEVAQIIYEGETKVEYRHFRTPNESIHLGMEHQMVAKRETPRHHVPPDGRTQHAL